MFVHSLNVSLKWDSTVAHSLNVTLKCDSNVCSFLECLFEVGFQCLFIL